MSRTPGPTKAQRAHQALALALDALTHRVPCHGDDRFISESYRDRGAAVEVCEGCPILAVCAEAGQHETWGVWAGIDRAASPTKRKRTA